LAYIDLAVDIRVSHFFTTGSGDHVTFYNELIVMFYKSNKSDVIIFGSMVAPTDVEGRLDCGVL
jgi:hypothetical protein